MQYDISKVYVTTDLIGLEPFSVLCLDEGAFFWNDLHEINTFFYKTFEEAVSGRKVYVLESSSDLVAFIIGKRDFPIFKTDEEEEKKEKNQINEESKIDKINDVLDELFDDELKLKEPHLQQDYCKGKSCFDVDFDCRACLKDFLKEILK